VRERERERERAKDTSPFFTLL